MHTRIVSLYHEVVEFGISAKDDGVSGFSFDVKRGLQIQTIA